MQKIDYMLQMLMASWGRRFLTSTKGVTLDPTH